MFSITLPRFKDTQFINKLVSLCIELAIHLCSINNMITYVEACKPHTKQKCFVI